MITLFYTTDKNRDLVRLPISNEEDFDRAVKFSAALHGDTVCVADLVFYADKVFVKPRGERASRFYSNAVIEADRAVDGLYWALNEEVDLPGIRTLLINLRAGWRVTLAVNAPDFK